MIIQIYGKPGAGKTTLFSMIAHNNAVLREKYYKRVNKSELYHKIMTCENSRIRHLLLNSLFPKNFYDVVYSTEETLQDTVYIEFSSLGRFKPTENSLFLLDESSIGLDSRNYKEISKFSTRFASIHRHLHTDLVLSSQSCDTDKKYRQRTEHVFVIKKVGKRSILKKIYFDVGVDELQHTIVDGYYKQKVLAFLLDLLITSIPGYKKGRLPLRRSMCFKRKKYYKYFDSYHDNFNYPDEDPYLIRLIGIDEPTDPYDIYIKEQLKREAEELRKEESEVT